MESYEASTPEELNQIIKSYGDQVVYRGQIRHFLTPDGQTNIPTSFSRHGCIPPLMQQWTYYASTIIRALSGPGSPEPQLELSQAILQHYGWRSFYVDVTLDPCVAAWFASHRLVMRHQLQMCEDCFEEGIFLVIDAATYERSIEAHGHIYVISPTWPGSKPESWIDLTKRVAAENPVRFHAQRAGLIGPLDERLPSEAILARISAPTELLSQYANSRGYVSAETLFPSRSLDLLAELLLAAPWKRIETGSKYFLPTYSRSLALPEYDKSFIKHRSASEAFFTNKWVDEDRGGADSPLKNALFVRVSAFDLYGSPEAVQRVFPKLTALLKEHGIIVLESAGILRYPEQFKKSDYMKGVVLQYHPGVVEVSALMIDHPGMQFSGFEVEAGWHYEVSSDGNWTRRQDARDCPCNAPYRHEQHLVAIGHVESALGSARIGARGPKSLVSKSVME